MVFVPILKNEKKKKFISFGVSETKKQELLTLHGQG